jgi:hypothetical protein
MLATAPGCARQTRAEFEVTPGERSQQDGAMDTAVWQTLMDSASPEYAGGACIDLAN